MQIPLLKELREIASTLNRIANFLEPKPAEDQVSYPEDGGIAYTDEKADFDAEMRRRWGLEEAKPEETDLEIDKKP